MGGPLRRSSGRRCARAFAGCPPARCFARLLLRPFGPRRREHLPVVGRALCAAAPGGGAAAPRRAAPIALFPRGTRCRRAPAADLPALAAAIETSGLRSPRDLPLRKTNATRAPRGRRRESAPCSLPPSAPLLRGRKHLLRSSEAQRQLSRWRRRGRRPALRPSTSLAKPAANATSARAPPRATREKQRGTNAWRAIS